MVMSYERGYKAKRIPISNYVGWVLAARKHIEYIQYWKCKL